MSELRSTVDALRSETLAELPDARIEEDFAELHRAIEQLEAERLRRLAEIERRGLHQRDGFLSAEAWLVSRFGTAWGAAGECVRIARGLEAMPVTRRALDEGEVLMSAVRVLVAARDADPEAFARSEEALVDAARVHTVTDLQRVTAFWREAVEREHALDGEDRVRARRRLHASASLLGMVRVDGDLDHENGELLLTALRAVMDAESRSVSREDTPDDRTPAQRRADALGEICRQWLDLAERPTVAGERPHVTVTVDGDALAGRAGSAAELDHAGPVRAEIARQLACDGSVMRVVMSGRSESLDVGRRTAVVSPSMRRAVIVCDRHCRFPGCDRPHTWCDAHHAVHWADGGPTAVSNLLLLCRRHHRMIHWGRFRLELEEGRPVFRRPDDSILGAGSSPRRPGLVAAASAADRAPP